MSRKELTEANNILVTGFGPFGIHKINASWEAVKRLPKDIEGFNVIIKEIPVCYDTVDTKIKHLWNEHKPQLVVHVGVSQQAKQITLETCAYKEGYVKKDHFGNDPSCGTVCPVNCQENCLQTGINVKDICDHLNSNKDMEACVSKDAGRYLCEYVFYTSLSVDKNRTLFIHVPCLGQPYSAEQLADCITQVIKCALNQCTSIIPAL